MEPVHIQFYPSPVGELILGSHAGKLCLCDWRFRKMRKAIDARILQGLDSVFLEEQSEMIGATQRQLDQYFAGERTEFDIPLFFVGTEFQKRVWNGLLEIPYGQTSTYLELSAKLGDERAIRAVASANGANALSILVPCHRLIGTDGKLVGYAGGLEAKRKLLALEGVYLHGQMDLFD